MARLTITANRSRDEKRRHNEKQNYRPERAVESTRGSTGRSRYALCMSDTGGNECRAECMNKQFAQTALLDEIQQDKRQGRRFDEVSVSSDSLLELCITARTNPDLRR